MYLNRIQEARLNQLGQSIKTARKNLGLSIRELGRRCDVPASVISDLENGKTRFSRYLKKIAEGLGLDIETLDSGEVVLVGTPGVTTTDPLVLTDKTIGALISDNGIDFSLVSPDSELSTRRAPYNGAEGFWFIYSGQAMQPTLKEGETLYVDTLLAPESGDVVVALMSGDRLPVVRRLLQEGGQSMLVADNNDWPGRVRSIRPVDKASELKAPESDTIGTVDCLVLGVAIEAVRSLT